jgi:hypothetical protein
MNYLKSFLLLNTFFLFFLTAQAQNNSNNKTFTKVSKSQLPQLKTFLGSYTDSVSITAAEASSIIRLPIRITDKKNNVYTVTYYECMYKRLAVVEDEATGKLSPTYSIAAEHFNTTPLSNLWIKKISEEIKAGEEIFFFDILVKDPSGRVMYAPNLKIMVK